ncbi:128_t:CDS:2 [Funneliformis caledonium]|uniref:128_t:CDS:1 n=1 Tax=Funneliformis caledonium TaxID=1117310 RepID=A0A9N8VFK2_9GLOM|nr:128_t:CDS:2 [Funneliformis caledonium]
MSYKLEFGPSVYIRFNRFSDLSTVSVQRRSAFQYPRLVKRLETVERETSTPISFNLVTTEVSEIEGCLRIYCPINILSGTFVAESISAALRMV